jgi:hypothetical protein
MRANPRFWTAFGAGLAAPVGLYAASAAYAFAAVGTHMSRAWPGIR